MRTKRPKPRKTGGNFGGFKDDEKMPLFSNAEFDAAYRYLNLRIELENTEPKPGEPPLTHLAINSELVPIERVRAECDQLEAVFRETVREETLRINPNAGQHAFTTRARDIINAMLDTSYISEDKRSR